MHNPLTEHPVTLRWMREGTAFVVGLVDKLTDEELREPSALPNWGRSHVLAHLARNAEAIGRLARWARTGVETPMYPSYQQRNLDIEISARHDMPTLRAELTDTAAALAREISLLDERSWSTPVRTAQGDVVPATVIPWMRAREVWLHGVDLDAGGELDALPTEMVDALLANLVHELSGKPDCPAVLLAPGDRDYTRALGRLGRAPTVRGDAVDLVAWLSGRRLHGTLSAHTEAGPTEIPKLPRWL